MRQVAFLSPFDAIEQHGFHHFTVNLFSPPLVRRNPAAQNPIPLLANGVGAGNATGEVTRAQHTAKPDVTDERENCSKRDRDRAQDKPGSAQRQKIRSGCQSWLLRWSRSVRRNGPAPPRSRLCRSLG